MYFYLSKTVGFLVLPSNLLILLCFIGIVLMATRFKRTGRGLALGSLIVMTLVGFFPIGGLLLHKLESRFPAWDASRGAPDGIVVLGGAISPMLSQTYGQIAVNGNAGRVIAIAKLARDYPNLRIVYSGGDASLFADGLAEAVFLPPLLDIFGVARERVLLESRSRNTVENAVFSRDLVKPKPGERWLVVTSAAHMPRSIGCFRKAGFAVEAYPVSWTTGKEFNLFRRTEFASGLGRLDSAAYEWIGLAAYWLAGHTSELLPGPAPRS